MNQTTPTTAQAQTAQTETIKADKPLSDFEKLLLKDSKTRIEFKPFQSDTNISLSVHMVRSYIAVPAKDNDGKELWPDDRQCTKFIMLCLARKLNPYEGDAFMIPFWNKSLQRHDWSLITAHAAFLKRGEVHPDYDGKSSGIIVSPAAPCAPCKSTGVLEGKLCPRCDGQGGIDEIEGDYLPDGAKLAGGWCKVFYKGKGHPEHQRLRLSTYSKTFGNWTFDGAGMICKCAEAAALRSAFPNTMAGMYLREEMGLSEASEPESQMSRPLFTQATPEPPKMPQDEKQGVRTPESVQESPPIDSGGKKKTVEPTATPKTDPKPAKLENASVSGIRLLMKPKSITEAELLAFLIATGSADTGTDTLEELALANDSIIGILTSSWPSIESRLIEAREGQTQ